MRVLTVAGTRPELIRLSRLVPLLDAIARHAPLLAEGKDSSFMNKVHLDTAPEDSEGKAAGSKTESSKNGI